MSSSSWEWTPVAALESQIAGLLACFLFAAIVLLLGNPPAGKKVSDISTPLYSSLVVFFSLVVSAFLYAMVTGNRDAQRASIAVMLANAVFALATVEMFHCLVWFFADYQVAPRVMAKTRLLYHEVTLIAAALTAISVTGITGSKSLLDVLPVMVLPLLGIALRKPISRRLTEQAQERFPALLMYASSLFTVAVAIYLALVNHADQLESVYRPAVGFWLTFILGAFFMVCEIALPFEERSTKEPDSDLRSRLEEAQLLHE